LSVVEHMKHQAVLLSIKTISIIWITVYPYTCLGQQGPSSVGPVPNARQIEWYHREMIAFFHFGMNTFTNENEGEGIAKPEVFNPSDLDCKQWMSVLKRGGISSAILVAKHADGFCNWPTAYSNYSVKHSNWKEGKGDVVREFTKACEAAGIKAGIYLGPFDRHDARYGTNLYSEYYASQLSELLRNYGKIWEIWWDGAGADQLTTAIYTRWADTVRTLQPQCVIFGTKNSYAFADCRWVGNESGFAGDPCWSVINPVSIKDEVSHINELNHGEVDGTVYAPAEVDVSIRPSWFYHPEEDDKVKTLPALWDIYFQSVGRNSVLLLNFAPDKRGLIPATDAQRIDSLKWLIDETFRTNLAKGAKVKSNHSRGKKFTASHLVDDREDTFFSTPNEFYTDTITFDLKTKKVFDCLKLQEVIELGHRTTKWSVEYSLEGKQWVPIPEATNKEAIGYKWLIRFKAVKARYVRLKIIGGKACPAIHSFGLYKQPKQIEASSTR
jgi:alpha-L-fucosidase